MPPLASQDEILLLSACARPSRRQRLRLRATLAAPLDWEALGSVLWAHGTAPLLYRHLQQNGLLSLLPAPARAWLERWAQATLFRNLRLRRDLQALLRAARDLQTPILLLKGAALAEFTYPHWGLRPMVDLDVLVPQNALPDMEARLARLGYELKLSYPSTREAWQRYHMHLAYQREGQAGSVEIHWRLFAPFPRLPFRISAESVWERALARRLDDLPVQVMAWEDAVVYLCIHHLTHGGESLLGWCDLAALVGQPLGPARWTALIDRAQEARAERVVGYALWWIQRYLASPVPEDLPGTLCPQAAHIDRLRRRLDRGPAPRADLIGNRWSQILRILLLLGDSRARALFLRDSLFPPPAAFSRFFPISRSGEGYAFYLLHPARLRRATRSLVRLLLPPGA